MFNQCLRRVSRQAVFVGLCIGLVSFASADEAKESKTEVEKACDTSVMAYVKASSEKVTEAWEESKPENRDNPFDIKVKCIIKANGALGRVELPIPSPYDDSNQAAIQTVKAAFADSAPIPACRKGKAIQVTYVMPHNQRMSRKVRRWTYTNRLLLLDTTSLSSKKGGRVEALVSNESLTWLAVFQRKVKAGWDWSSGRFGKDVPNAVRLQVSIRADGTVERAKVLSSSGNKKKDKMAQSMVMQVRGLGDLPNALANSLSEGSGGFSLLVIKLF